MDRLHLEYEHEHDDHDHNDHSHDDHSHEHRVVQRHGDEEYENVSVSELNGRLQDEIELKILFIKSAIQAMSS